MAQPTVRQKASQSATGGSKLPLYLVGRLQAEVEGAVDSGPIEYRPVVSY
jgi:hypothetical protein